MGGLAVDDEIPLLSWSLHLLGEAEWAGAVGAAFGFSSCASLRLILVLKLVRSLRTGRWPAVGVGRSPSKAGAPVPPSSLSSGFQWEFIPWSDPG